MAEELALDPAVTPSWAAFEAVNNPLAQNINSLALMTKHLVNLSFTLYTRGKLVV